MQSVSPAALAPLLLALTMAVPSPEPSASPKDRALIRLSNALLLATSLVAVVIIAFFVNPSLVPSRLRPATPKPTATSDILVTPSPTELVLLTETATATSTRKALTTARTSTRTSTPSATRPQDTSTPASTRTQTAIPTGTPTPTRTLTPTLTPTITLSTFRYTVQDGYPRYVPYPGGCNWMGFSGQVFDLNRQLVIDVVVHIGGVDYLTLSGASLDYDIPGWVQKVASQPAGTQGYYTVQLQDVMGNPLSERVAVTTILNCAQNMVLINFIQNH